MSLTALDWDVWRANYDVMTVDDQRVFYNQLFEDFPDQQRFDTTHIDQLLVYIGRPVSVVELGGWDGGFAREMLARTPEIWRWQNWEISHNALESAGWSDPRYEPFALTRWYWDRRHEADVFVASHVLEHLKLVDVLKCFDATACNWMYLQSPIGDEVRDWQGYRGTHIIEVGWGELELQLKKRGYTYLESISHPWARCFERDPQN